MKKVTLFFLLICLTGSLTLSANNNTTEDDVCSWQAWFKYPQNNGGYEPGKDVYVRVDPQKYQDIEYMELYVNGKYVRKESAYPYEWCKGPGNTDGYLRNLQVGTYKLTCKVKDKCGQYHEYHCTIYVKGNQHDGGQNDHNNECTYNVWYKSPQNGSAYGVGKDGYVYLGTENYQSIKYVELYVNDKFIRKETSYPYEWCKGPGNSDSYLRNLQAGTYKLKARVYDHCGAYKDYYSTFYVKNGQNGEPGGGGYEPVCTYKSWFKYPQNNGKYKYGSDVYVRVDTEKYQDVEEMQLYVNGKYLRSEKTYPYEWCKGPGNSDHYLRNLQKGAYNLKARVKTKCGEWHEYYSKFYVQ